MEDQLDLLAGVLAEGGDDLLDRLVLLGVIALVPPHDEIGGLGGERRHDERRRENYSSNAQVPPPSILPRSMSLLPVHGKDAHGIRASGSD